MSPWHLLISTFHRALVLFTWSSVAVSPLFAQAKGRNSAIRREVIASLTGHLSRKPNQWLTWDRLLRERGLEGWPQQEVSFPAGDGAPSVAILLAGIHLPYRAMDYQSSEVPRADITDAPPLLKRMLLNPWIYWRFRSDTRTWDLLVMSKSPQAKYERVLVWIHSPFQTPRVQILGPVNGKTLMQTIEGDEIGISAEPAFTFEFAPEDTCDSSSSPFIVHRKYGLVPIVNLEPDWPESEVDDEGEPSPSKMSGEEIERVQRECGYSFIRQLVNLKPIHRSLGFVFLRKNEIIAKTEGPDGTQNFTEAKIVALEQGTWDWLIGLPDPDDEDSARE